MSRGNTWSRRKALSLLALAACLPAAAGCGEEQAKVAPSGPVESSNQEMIDFMKSQQAKNKNKK